MCSERVARLRFRYTYSYSFFRPEGDPAMAYNQFTTVQSRERFGLQIVEQAHLFADAPPVEISALLRETLAADIRLALRSHSEKARSEYIIAPIMAEVYRQMQGKANLFSGVEFNVDTVGGLAGFCAFPFSLSPVTIEREAPVVSLVEAKKENILKGIPQCFAELVAAQIFNENAGRPFATLCGAAATGPEWQFLRLQGTTATLDQTEYPFSDVQQIVGIFVWMLQNTA